MSEPFGVVPPKPEPMPSNTAMPMVALDCEPKKAADIIELLGPDVWYKIGWIGLSSKHGMDLAESMHECGNKWMLDVKLYDTPNTVVSAAAGLARTLKPNFLTLASHWLHCKRHFDELDLSTSLVAVYKLSTDHDGFTDNDLPPGMEAYVCPPQQAGSLRRWDKDALIICPGVRLPGTEAHEHRASFMVPPHADLIVVGRPIIDAPDPKKAYDEYVAFCRGQR